MLVTSVIVVDVVRLALGIIINASLLAGIVGYVGGGVDVDGGGLGGGVGGGVGGVGGGVGGIGGGTGGGIGGVGAAWGLTRLTELIELAAVDEDVD